MTYSKRSPYALTPTYGSFSGYYVHRSVPPHATDSYDTVRHGWVSRPDLLALDIYGDSEFWWVVPLRNGLEDPIYGLTYDLVVAVPSKDRVLKMFGG